MSGASHRRPELTIFVPGGARRATGGSSGCQARNGRLKLLPALPPAEELLGVARKRMYALDEDLKERLKMESRLRRGNARGSWGLPQARAHGTQKLQALSASLTRPLKEVLNAHDSLQRRLHPFERVVAELTISSRERNGAMPLAGALASAAALKTTTGTALKDAAARAARAESADALDAIIAAEWARTEALVLEHDAALEVVREYSRALRAVPTLDDSLPTVVLVGAPNVGKSSLVRALSTGKPVVADYPFTTRSMTMGHMLDPLLNAPMCQVCMCVDVHACRYTSGRTDGRTDACMHTHQVMDTPGVLPRDSRERNLMEKLTLACVEHLPAAIVFVLDRSGLAVHHENISQNLCIHLSECVRISLRMNALGPRGAA